MKSILAIHGVGMVGGAHARYFLEQGHEVRQIDPAKRLDDPIHDVALHFICVPTPYQTEGNGFDLSFVRAALSFIATNRASLPTLVVIKSTVLPGTTAALQKEYPDFSLFFSPEFLTEKNADHDLRHPDRVIVGSAQTASAHRAKEILDLFPEAPFRETMSATEAELVKYFGNAFLATKVIFSNLIFDFCEKLGLDYERVSQAAGYDRRIGHSHMNVLHDGYRGYGGSCFPKDVRALIQKARELGLDAGLLEEAERLNAVYRSKSIRREKAE